MSNPRKPTDPGHNSFDLRKGVGATTEWRGIRKQGSAALMQPGDLRHGVNIRPCGDGYRERGGQAKFITSPASGKIDGIFDFGDHGAV